MNDDRLEQELIRAGEIAGGDRSMADDVMQEIARAGAGGMKTE